MNGDRTQTKRGSWGGRAVAAGLLGLLLVMAGCGPSETKAPAGGGPEATKPAPPKIVSFYPGQPAVAPGDQAQFCYGVENAVSVRLEPPVEEIRPLTSKCVWFKPSGSMKLTLIATGAGGEEARESIDITVRSGAPSSTETPAASAASGIIETFIATATTVSPGGGSTICYVLREPATLSMQPASGDLGSDLKKCVLVRPKATTKYTLTARAGGRTDSASVTVRVQ
jgi:hypothetical protein